MIFKLYNPFTRTDIDIISTKMFNLKTLLPLWSSSSKFVIINFFYFTLLLFQFQIKHIDGQENAQFRIPKSLEECYRDDFLLQRDNRLPMTITTLIELIQKIESVPSYNQDIRQISVSLLHRFKQDGIAQAPGIQKTDEVLPYSPSEFQFSKHRLLLSRLIPGNAYNFPNDTLTSNERCSLHFMLSNTIEKRVRGDEGQRCNQLSQFRSSMRRLPREINDNNGNSNRKNYSKYFPISSNGQNNFLYDVEMVETLQSKIKTKPLSNSEKIQRKLSSRRGQNSFGIDEKPTVVKYPNNKDVNNDDDEYYDYDDQIGRPVETNFNNLYDIASDSISQCPVESGIIWTPWGAVSAGTLIAGIAAGLQPQKVQLRQLIALSRRNRGNINARQYNYYVDNKWAATLAGDLAEVALIQAPLLRSNSDVTVGAAGAWNSTASPRWYFLTQRERLEMTDAEIRGGLDGLIIATKIQDWKNKASNLKLSQVLQMYYSQEGVLDTGVRACNRRALFAEVAPIDEIRSQALAFATVLDREIRLRVTLEEDGIKKFTQLAAEALSNYIPQSLNDLSCEATTPNPNDQATWHTASDLYIFVDTMWPFSEINPIISYILDRIDVGKYGTHVTIMTANDCKYIVNTTDRTMDVQQTWNSTKQQEFPTGLNLPNILRVIHDLSADLMEDEKRNSSSSGRSLVALIVPYTATVNEGDSYYSKQQLQILHEEVPDLRVLFMANGSPRRFEEFVVESNKDLFSARQGLENVASSALPVVQRILEIPRRIVNYRCGSNWHPDDYGISQMNQYITPDSVTFYRLHPNYFFGASDNRKLRIQGQGTIGLTICTSRQNPLPRKNSTQNKDDIECRQLVSDTFEIDLNNPCDGLTYINQCRPLYISAEGKRTGTSSAQIRCTDLQCQRQDQIKFLIQHENLGCFNSSNRYFINILIISIALVFKFIF